MRQIFLIAMTSVALASCTKYKIRAIDSRAIELVNTADDNIKAGYKVGDTVLFSHRIWEAPRPYVIIEVNK